MATTIDEITLEMIEAGEAIICQHVGSPGDVVGGFFSARELAISVYLAMRPLDLSKTGGEAVCDK